MKKIIVILFLTVIQIIGQNIKVVDDIAVTNEKDGKFFYPSVSSDGSALLFTSENLKGLWYKNMVTGKSVLISSAPSSGYEPGFNFQNNQVIFREDDFSNGKRNSSLLSYDLSARKLTLLDKGIRDLKIVSNGAAVINNYVRNKELRTITNQQSLQKTAVADVMVSLEDSKLVLYENNIKRIIDPLNGGNYIWPSLSPDKTKLLFTSMGNGTFISDLNGKILSKLGYANYPSWSSDGKWVLFMKDIDDGTRVTSSNIYVVDLIKGQYYNLTSGRDFISLYPKWGGSNLEIFYNTDNGQIRKMKLKYE